MLELSFHSLEVFRERALARTLLINEQRIPTCDIVLCCALLRISNRIRAVFVRRVRKRVCFLQVGERKSPSFPYLVEVSHSMVEGNAKVFAERYRYRSQVLR